MKRLVFSLLALLWTFPAFAQLPMTGAGKATPGGGVAPTIVYNGGATAGVASGSILTYSAVPISPGLVVVMTYDLSASLPITGVTLNGTAMTLVANTASSATLEGRIFQLVVASGTSATIVVTYNSAPSNGTGLVDSYTITGYSSTTATGTLQATSSGASVTSVNGNLVSSAGGVAVVGAAQRGGGSSSGVITASGVTLTVDRNCYAIAAFSCMTDDHASGLAATTNNVTATFNGSQVTLLIGASWR